MPLIDFSQPASKPKVAVCICFFMLWHGISTDSPGASIDAGDRPTIKLKIGALFDTRAWELRGVFEDAIARHNAENEADDNDDILRRSDDVIRVIFEPVITFVDVTDSFAVSNSMCDLIAHDVIAVVGVTNASSLPTVQSYSATFHIPFLSLGSAQNVTSSASFQLSLRPPVMVAVVDLLQHHACVSALYVYDTDDGLMRIQDLFQAVNLREVYVELDVRRLGDKGGVSELSAIVLALHARRDVCIMLDLERSDVASVVNRLASGGSNVKDIILVTLDADRVLNTIRARNDNHRYPRFNISGLQLVHLPQSPLDNEPYSDMFHEHYRHFHNLYHERYHHPHQHPEFHRHHSYRHKDHHYQYHHRHHHDQHHHHSRHQQRRYSQLPHHRSEFHRPQESQNEGRHFDQGVRQQHMPRQLAKDFWRFSPRRESQWYEHPPKNVFETVARRTQSVLENLVRKKQPRRESQESNNRHPEGVGPFDDRASKTTTQQSAGLNRKGGIFENLVDRDVDAAAKTPSSSEALIADSLRVLSTGLQEVWDSVGDVFHSSNGTDREDISIKCTNFVVEKKSYGDELMEALRLVHTHGETGYIRFDTNGRREDYSLSVLSVKAGSHLISSEGEWSSVSGLTSQRLSHDRMKSYTIFGNMSALLQRKILLGIKE